MKTLDKGKDKIKQICDVLREETIAPAKEEGQRIVRDAKAEADEIIAKARAGRIEIGEETSDVLLGGVAVGG